MAYRALKLGSNVTRKISMPFLWFVGLSPRHLCGQRQGRIEEHAPESAGVTRLSLGVRTLRNDAKRAYLYHGASKIS